MQTVSQRITLKMIAREVGTSIGTVDRAIRDRDGVSPTRRAQILQVARELGYRPNRVASALSRKIAPTVGVLYPTDSLGLSHTFDAGIRRAADDLMDYNVNVRPIRYMARDSYTLSRALEELDIRGLDGLAVNGAGPAASREIDRLVRQGLPVVTFNTDAPESRRLFYVGGAAFSSGRLGGELMAMLLGGGGHVVVLTSFAQSIPYIERFSGFCEFIQNRVPDIHVSPIPCGISDGDAEALALPERLGKLGDLRGIFCTSEDNTAAAIRFLRKTGRRDIRLVGYDVTKSAAQSLREGWCSALLHQAPTEQGYRAVRLLARHFLESWRPETACLYLPTQIVMRSNVDSYAGQLT